jgi:hypothetical protein
MRTRIARLEELGFQIEALPRAEATRWFASWCEAFCGAVQLRTGTYRHRGYHWHAFSSGLVRALDRQKALDEYARQDSESVFAIPEKWSSAPGFRVTGSPLPDLSFLQDDVYVFPESLEWSMVFTHEQPTCGPYFTWREWCRVS